MEYKVITAESFTAEDTAERLAEKVNKKLSEGWRLKGSQQTVPCEKEHVIKIIMSQAMIKK